MIKELFIKGQINGKKITELENCSSDFQNQIDKEF